MADSLTWTVERWRELHDEYTPASFHTRLHHSVTLLREIEAVAELCIREGPVWQSHVEPLVDEWVYQVGREARVLPWLPGDGIERRATESALRDAAQSARKDPVGFAALVSALIRGQDRFRGLLADTLETTTEKQRHCRELDTLLGLVSTELWRGGPEPVDMSNTVETVQTLAEFGEVVARQLRFEPDRHGTGILFVRADRGVLQSRLSVTNKEFALASHVRSQRAIEAAGLSADGWLAVEYKRMTIGSESLARDAWSRLSAVLDLHAFHRQEIPLKLAPQVVSLGTPTARFRISQPTLGLLKPRHSANRALSEMFAATDGMARFPDQFRLALFQYSMASEARSPESELVLLWSAAETLVGSSQLDRLSHVQRLLVPLLTHHSLSRRLRYVAQALRGLQIDQAPDVAALFPRSRRFSVDVVDLVHFLSTSAAGLGDEHARLLGGIRSPLARWRLAEENAIFRSTSKLKTRLIKAAQNRRWNIRRIYRARNLGVHAGFRHPDCSRLVGHLRDYVATAINRVLHDLHTGRAGTVREGLELRRLEYETLVRVLDSKGRDPIPVRLLLPEIEGASGTVNLGQ